MILLAHAETVSQMHYVKLGAPHFVTHYSSVISSTSSSVNKEHVFIVIRKQQQ